MLTAMTVLIFGGALGLSVYAMAATVMPRLGQIADVLYGQPATVPFAPLATLVRAERRIAVRRWAVAMPVRPTAYRGREAA